MLLKPTISVAVCTRNHPAELRTCLGSLAPLRTKVLEIIVVDNGSSGSATREAAEAFGARYVCEPVVGREAARNRAVSVARGEILAFTDDDCLIHAGWADGIAEAFRDPAVGCVTGPAMQRSEGNWVQQQFESFSRGFCLAHQVEARPASVNGVYYRAVLGVGANLACRTTLLRRTGGFRLTTGGSGEDDYIQYKVISAGYKVRYTPQAVVYEQHRSELGATLIRLFEYGMGTMRVVWQLSAEQGSFRQFLRNTAWLFLTRLWRLAGVALQARFCHLLFMLVDLAGMTAGIFLPWGWHAHLYGKLPPGGQFCLFPAQGGSADVLTGGSPAPEPS